jgi:hypothetical protein
MAQFKSMLRRHVLLASLGKEHECIVVGHDKPKIFGSNPSRGVDSYSAQRSIRIRRSPTNRSQGIVLEVSLQLVQPEGIIREAEGNYYLKMWFLPPRRRTSTSVL